MGLYLISLFPLQLFSMPSSKKQGSKLVELLLVVLSIAVLAGIVFVAINPTMQLSDTRNAQRRSDVKVLADALNQYAADTENAMEALGIPVTGEEIEGCGMPLEATSICQSGSDSCRDVAMVSLDALTEGGSYLPSIPVDPSGPEGTSGYAVVQDADSGHLTVCAPLAERGATIALTK